jgi:membrane-associated phospholipid phosphatase
MRVGSFVTAFLGAAPASGLNLQRGYHARAAESTDRSVSGRFKPTAKFRRDEARDLRLHGGSFKASRAVQRRSYKSPKANRALQRRSYNFPYKVDLVTEGILTAVLSLGFLFSVFIPEMILPTWENPCPDKNCPDNRDSIWGFEPLVDWVIGPEDAAAESFDVVSWFSLFGAAIVPAVMATPLLAAAIVPSVMARTMLNFTWQQLLEVLVVGVQAVSLAGILTQTVKSIVKRPRPYMYDSRTQQVPLSGNGDVMSFWSGHASASSGIAATVVATVYLCGLRGAKLATLAVAPVILAVGTSYLRLESHNHFVSDVVVGSLVGSAFGVGNAVLHSNLR